MHCVLGEEGGTDIGSWGSSGCRGRIAEAGALPSREDDRVRKWVFTLILKCRDATRL